MKKLLYELISKQLFLTVLSPQTHKTLKYVLQDIPKLRCFSPLSYKFEQTEERMKEPKCAHCTCDKYKRNQVIKDNDER